MVRAAVLAFVLTVLVVPAAERCVPGEVIVKLSPTLRGQVRPSAAAGTCRTGVPGLDVPADRWSVARWSRILPNPEPDCRALALGLDLLYLVRFDPANDPAAVAADFARSRLVEYACPNVLIEVGAGTDDVPDDPSYPAQWQLPRIRAPQAWDVAHGDSSVVIASVDDGARWTHPDIEDNLWINGSEDVNGNGRFDPMPFPAGDIDGVDQDTNGYADDVIGWDFAFGDPDPVAEGSDDHGTMCFGTADAVTDNGVGIAGPPWNCRKMVLRCGYGGAISLTNAVNAVAYAAGKRAWAVVLPWGTRTLYQPLADACRYLWDAGGLAVAAAGAYGDTGRVYPAACDSVIAVAASDQLDRRTVFSGYGTWIDVCAPGVDIITTSGDTGYTYWSGTGPACNIVAGVLGWFKSAYPDIDNDSALSLLRNLCDSMPDPLYPLGLLGAGRIAMVPDTVTGVVDDGIVPKSLRAHAPTVVRGVLRVNVGSDRTPYRATLRDAAGRRVMDLVSGDNDVSVLNDGIYFVVRHDRPPERILIVR